MKNLLFVFVFLSLLIRVYSQGVGIGSTLITPDVSAMLEVRSTEKGVLIPRMTTAQRNAISNPANGLLILNIDTRCFEWWDSASSQWIPMGCVCPPPSAPVANAASGVTATSFVANWTAVTGATGYFLDVATNITFTSFVPGYNNLNVGNVTSYNVTGLTCGTQYFYRVRAVNACGVGPNSNTISVTTNACPVCLSRQYGGTGNDYAYSIIQTSDGGYAVAARTGSFGAGSWDFWVLKLASDGTVQWQRTYGGAGWDIAYSIIQTNDGGYAVTGYTESFGAGGTDLWILKLASDGTIQWQRMYGGGSGEEARSIIQTSDGGYAVAGQTNSFGAGGGDFWVLKLASDGVVQWRRTYGGASFDYAYSIIQTSDGGYAVAGGTFSFGAGSCDFWILKFASDGTVQWQRTYGGVNSDEAYSIIQTSDGGYAVAGQTNSFGAGGGDFWVLKLASDGVVQWQRTYGGANADIAFSIIQTSDGGYAVAGQTSSFGAGGGDFWVLKLASDGTIQWQRTYGGTSADITWSIIQTSDGGYAVAGGTQSFGAGSMDFWVIKLNSSGLGPGCGANTAATVANTNATVNSTTATVTTITSSDPTTNATPQVTNCTVSNGCPCP